MVFVYIVVIFSFLFILTFIYQLIDSWKFFYSKNIMEEGLFQEYIPKRYIVKNKHIITLSKKKIWLQSKVFYAKFLKERAYKNLPISIKFLVDEIYTKLCFNFNYFNNKIAFDKLKNAGIFNGKPIYKIVVKNKKELEKELQALEIVNKFFNFRTIFILEVNSEEDFIEKFILENALTIDYKVISMKDINLNLLYEINKLNLNYKVEEHPKKIDDFSFPNIDFNIVTLKWNMEEYTSKNREIVLNKFIKVDTDFSNSSIGYFIKFNPNNGIKRIGFSINYRLKSELFNVRRHDDFLEVKYWDSSLKTQKFFFTKSLREHKIQKIDGYIFLRMYFSILVNDKCNFFLLTEDFEDIKRLSFQDVNNFLLKNNLKIDSVFKFKIYIKDKQFNEFFNKKLKKLVISERLREKNTKFVLSYSIKKTIEKNFNINWKKTADFSSFFELYNFLITEVLGIEEKASGIFLNPKKEYFNKNFKLVFLKEDGINRSVYVQQNSEFKGLELGDVLYTNLKLVDLNLIKKNAKLCI